MRYETEPGEQAQVDWGLFRYTLPGGGTRQIWAYVMVVSWSQEIYVEFVQRADVATCAATFMPSGSSEGCRAGSSTTTRK